MKKHLPNWRVAILAVAAALLPMAAWNAAAQNCPMAKKDCPMTAKGCPMAGKDCPMAVAQNCPMKGGACCAEGKMMAAADAPKEAKAAAKEAKADDYPLDTCPVSGRGLGKMGKPAIYHYQGREVRFCCPGCIKPFEKDPAKYIKAMDQAIIKKEKAGYPLKTCVVSGNKLGGDMGAPVDYVYNNHLVRLCCPACIKSFTKDPKPFLKKISEARAAQEAKKKPVAVEKKG